MLYSNFNAILGDFGLVRALENEKTSHAEVDGLIRYIAPECFHANIATQQDERSLEAKDDRMDDEFVVEET
ncbi:hypothetical protein ACJIZ3_002450 [Penstemon smallii]|uniref:Protein kinase domain-containing protein n=1 Tax=Penstemon smallii TaxID=265156 RepID=A0ABD3U9Q5_9LAMI